jgi:hypothetical protein
MGHHGSKDLKNPRVILIEEAWEGVAQNQHSHGILPHSDRQAYQRAHDAGKVDGIESRFPVDIPDVRAIRCLTSQLHHKLGKLDTPQQGGVRVAEEKLVLLSNAFQIKRPEVSLASWLENQTAVLCPEILEHADDDLGADFLEIILVLDGLDYSVESREESYVFFEQVIDFTDSASVAAENPLIEISLLGERIVLDRFVRRDHRAYFGMTSRIIDENGFYSGANPFLYFHFATVFML